MIYVHSFSRVYLGLLALLLSGYFLVLLIQVHIISGHTLSIYTDNLDIWLSPKFLMTPVLFILFFPPIGAYLIQWSYKCTISNGVLYGKNSIGLRAAMDLTEVSSIKSYNIPFMPIIKISTPNIYWSIWVPGNVLEKLK